MSPSIVVALISTSCARSRCLVSTVYLPIQRMARIWQWFKYCSTKCWLGAVDAVMMQSFGAFPMVMPLALATGGRPRPSSRGSHEVRVKNPFTCWKVSQSCCHKQYMGFQGLHIPLAKFSAVSARRITRLLLQYEVLSMMSTFSLGSDNS